MKRTNIIVMVIVPLLCVISSAQLCPSFNNTNVLTDSNTDTSGHYSGYHGIQSVAPTSCTYTGANCGGYCSTTDTVGVANGAPAMTETGVTSLCHQTAKNSTSDVEVNVPGQPVIAKGQQVGAVASCISCYCGLSINMNPVTFTTAPIWSHTSNFGYPCASQTPPSCGGGGGGGGGCCPPGACSPIIIDASGKGFH